MTELTPLARKLWDAHNDTRGHIADAWNNVAKVAEAELTAPRAVRLPTAEECRQAIADRYALEGYPTGDYSDWCASVVLDLAAKLNPTWVEVPPDATIPSGTRVRTEQDINYTSEKMVISDWPGDRRSSKMRFFVPSGTVLEFPLDPRVETVAKAIAKSDCGDGGADWDGLSAAERDIYVAFAKAAIAALGEDI